MNTKISYFSPILTLDKDGNPCYRVKHVKATTEIQARKEFAKYYFEENIGSITCSYPQACAWSYEQNISFTQDYSDDD